LLTIGWETLKSIYLEEVKKACHTPKGKICFWKGFLDDFLEPTLMIQHRSPTLKVISSCKEYNGMGRGGEEKDTHTRLMI